MPTEFVYKVLDAVELAAAEAEGDYAGSAHDRRDGFIHLSGRDQVAGVIERYFIGRGDLCVIAFRPADLGADLRWEANKTGEEFPHLYAPLPMNKARSRWIVVERASGRHELPTPFRTGSAGDLRE